MKRFRETCYGYFQFGAVVKPRLEATKQLAIRLSGTFSTFNSHGESARRACTRWRERIPNGETRTLPCASEVRIQMRRNDHDASRWTSSTHLSGEPGITVFPIARNLSGISIAKAHRMYLPNLQRDLNVPLLFILVLDLFSSRCFAKVICWWMAPSVFREI